MVSDRNALLECLIEHELGPDWRERPADPIAPWEAIELLWPLNAAFRSVLPQISEVPLCPGREGDADLALERWALGQSEELLLSNDPSLARLLLERHVQAMAFLAANAAAENPVIVTLPRGLSAAAKRRALVLFLCHGVVIHT